MRYAILSDLHGNYPALRAVIADCKNQRAEQLICLGDIVGYGPQSHDTFIALRNHNALTVQGNHDAALCGALSTTNFTEFAKSTLALAKGDFNTEELKELHNLPWVLEIGDMVCTHGAFTHPQVFPYIDSVQMAKENLQFVTRDRTLLFVGHTHIAALFVEKPDGSITQENVHDFKVQPQCRYLINPGAVGFSRDRCVEASYIIYDSEENTIVFRRVPYDCAGYRNALIHKGYPLKEHYWFIKGNETPPPQVSSRKIRDPHPEQTALEQPLEVANPTACQATTSLRGTWLFIETSRILQVFVFALAVLLAVILILLLRRLWHEPETQVTTSEPPAQHQAMETVEYYVPRTDRLTSSLLPPIETKGKKFKQWSYTLSTDKGSITPDFRNGQRSFKITAPQDEAMTFTLITPYITLEHLKQRQDRDLRFIAHVDFFATATGSVSYTLQQYKSGADQPMLLKDTPLGTIRQDSSRKERNNKVTFLANTESVRLKITGSFTGTIELFGLTLEPERPKEPQNKSTR